MHGLSCIESVTVGFVALCMGKSHGMGNVATGGRSGVTKCWQHGTHAVGEGWAARAGGLLRGEAVPGGAAEDVRGQLCVGSLT